MPSPAVALLYCPCPNPDAAVELARGLLDDRLIACGNVLPGVRSVYRWEGAIEDAAEAVLVCKPPSGRAAAAAAELERRHPYETPAVLTLPAEASAAFAAWVAGEVAGGRPSAPAA